MQAATSSFLSSSQDFGQANKSLFSNSTLDHSVQSYLPEALLSSALSLWNFLLSIKALRESAKLFILGGLLELGRRIASTLWTSFIDSFFVTAEFEDKDDTFSELCGSMFAIVASLPSQRPKPRR